MSRFARLLLTTAWACSAYAQQWAGVQAPLAAAASEDPGVLEGPKQVITPDIKAFTDNLMRLTNVQGLSLAVVRLENNTAIPEFGTWGNRTEDGDAVQADVRVSFTRNQCVSFSMTISSDPIQHWIDLKGVPCERTRYPHGRLRERQECDYAPSRGHFFHLGHESARTPPGRLGADGQLGERAREPQRHSRTCLRADKVSSVPS